MTERKPRKTCKHCKKKFTPARADQLYCSQACGQSARRSEQDKDKVLLSQLHNTGFFSYLHYQSKRAGTVEVVPKKLEHLAELHAIWSYNNKANAYKKSRKYEICHIHPVCGVKGKIGTLHPSNLVVQPATFNRSHGTKHLGNGHSISKYRLKPEWCIPTGAEKADIIELIFKRIGIPTLKQFKKECQPSTLAIVKELEWFRKNVCLVDDSVVLDQLDLEHLRELKADFQDNDVFHLSFEVYKESRVIRHELERLSVRREDIRKLCQWLAELPDPHPPTYAGAEVKANCRAYWHIFRLVESTSQMILAGASIDLRALVQEYDAKRCSALADILSDLAAEQVEKQLSVAAYLANPPVALADSCPF